jgi:hypothetical protein
MKVNGKYKPYLSVTQAVNTSPYMHAMCVQYNIKPRNLLCMMKREKTSLKKVKKQVRTPFTQELKERRMKIAQELHTIYNLTPSYFKNIFFVDAKKIHIMPKGVAVWVDAKTDEFMLEDARTSASGKTGVTLQFYAVVNAVAGPVAMVYTTGTTGMKGFGGQEYLVSEKHTYIICNLE